MCSCRFCVCVAWSIIDICTQNSSLQASYRRCLSFSHSLKFGQAGPRNSRRINSVLGRKYDRKSKHVYGCS